MPTGQTHAHSALSTPYAKEMLPVFSFDLKLTIMFPSRSPCTALYQTQNHISLTNIIGPWGTTGLPRYACGKLRLTCDWLKLPGLLTCRLKLSCLEGRGPKPSSGCSKLLSLYSRCRISLVRFPEALLVGYLWPVLYQPVSLKTNQMFPTQTTTFTKPKTWRQKKGREWVACFIQVHV